MPVACACLDEADRHRRVLGQPRGDDAARRPPARDHDIELSIKMSLHHSLPKHTAPGAQALTLRRDMVATAKTILATATRLPPASLRCCNSKGAGLTPHGRARRTRRKAATLVVRVKMMG